MITDRQLRDYVEGETTRQGRQALEAGLQFDPVAQELLRDQLRVHNALAAMSAESELRNKVRCRIFEQAGIHPASGVRQSTSHNEPRKIRSHPWRPPKRRRLKFLVPLATTVTTLATLAFLLWPPRQPDPAIGSLVDVTGDISLIRQGALLDPEKNLPVLAEDVMTLGSAGEANLLLKDGTMLSFIGPAVVTAVTSMKEISGASARVIRLKIDRGRLNAVVPPQMGGQVTFQTPHLVVIPISGTCGVSVDLDGTGVTVKSGVFSIVNAAGEKFEMQPGDSYFAGGSP